MEQFDVLIVGTGLAGSIVAHQLISLDKTFKSCTGNDAGAAFSGSSGIVNPVTGRKLVKSWRIDDVLPYSLQFYKDIERSEQKSFLQEYPIHRYYDTAEIANTFSLKTGNSAYQNYLQEHNHHYGIINKGFQVNIPFFVQHTREMLRSKNLLLEQEFIHESLSMQDNEVIYEDQKYKTVIFCEGYQVYKNPYFSEISIQPNKGEYLRLTSSILGNNQIIKNKLMLAPFHRKREFWFGATTNFFNRELGVTADGIASLKRLFTTLYGDANIIDEGFGIRPTSKDRRPYIGPHPEYNLLWMFNGFGTKGVSLIPYFANQLCSYLFEGKAIDKEVDVRRAFR